MIRLSEATPISLHLIIFQPISHIPTGKLDMGFKQGVFGGRGLATAHRAQKDGNSDVVSRTGSSEAA